MHLLVLSKRRNQLAVPNHDAGYLSGLVHEGLFLVVAQTHAVDHPLHLPDIGLGHTRARDGHVVDIHCEGITPLFAERRDACPKVIIGEIGHDRTQRRPGGQVLPITGKVREQSSDIAFALHDAVEEPEDPPLRRAGEEFANVEALDDAIASMRRRVGDIAPSLHGAKKELWRIDAGQNLREPCLHTFQCLAGIFDMPDAVARLLRDIKLTIECVAGRQRAEVRSRNAQQRGQLRPTTHLV